MVLVKRPIARKKYTEKMTSLTKPKRALLAYCALADRLLQPGAGPIQALTPFFSSVCGFFAGELFDASKFSAAVSERYGLQIPRLAALGLTEQLAEDGLLVAISGQATKTTIYRYACPQVNNNGEDVAGVSEREIDQVLEQFIAVCRVDPLLANIDDLKLQADFLDRLLHVDSMRLLTRREGPVATKNSTNTLSLNLPVLDDSERCDLRLDFHVAQYLLDLRDHHPVLFNRVSDIAFANMVAETLACFSEPVDAKDNLKNLAIYFDSPLLLDVLGVNIDYADYGRELLQMVKASGATTAVFDDCVVEAESVVSAQVAHARSGLSSKRTLHWATSAKPHILSALKDNVGVRAVAMGIEVHKDPDVAIFRRSESTYGDIHAEMTRRMKSWPNGEARNHDERSIWSMLKIRDSSNVCLRICDSRALLIARNTALVNIANDSWRTWLKGHGKHSSTIAARSAPVAMSDKQLAGYLWLRHGMGNGQMSRARLLAHCSAAVRPKPDVKARAYNLALELHGKQEADHLAALLEDREGERALMRAVRADPEDVTPERLPYIIEQVRLSAGEFAAAVVRVESEEKLAVMLLAHQVEIAQVQSNATAFIATKNSKLNEVQAHLLQKQLDTDILTNQLANMSEQLSAQQKTKHQNDISLLNAALVVGSKSYRRMRWLLVFLYSSTILYLTTFATEWQPLIQFPTTFIITISGFWFVPEMLERPACWYAIRQLKTAVVRSGAISFVPSDVPNFNTRVWLGLELLQAKLSL